GVSGSVAYSKDFIGFGFLQRKVTLDVNGGSEFEFHRLLFGRTADERRTSSSARLTVGLFRDRDGQWLRGFFALGRSKIRLSGENAPPIDPFQIATLDAGAMFYSESESLRFFRTFTLRPNVRHGLNALGGRYRYSVGSVSAVFTQAFPNRMELREYADASEAGQGTPVVELPSFGGIDSVRGCRVDEALGRRLWSIRSELWTPLPIRPGAGDFLEYLRKNLQFAGLFDAGGIYQTSSGLPGVRAGAGAGIRVKVARRV